MTFFSPHFDCVEYGALEFQPWNSSFLSYSTYSTMTSKESTPTKPLGTNEILVVGSEDEDQALKEHKTNSVYRFFANSLPGRAVESTVRTVFNTGRVSCLSPWGDSQYFCTSPTLTDC